MSRLLCNIIVFVNNIKETVTRTVENLIPWMITLRNKSKKKMSASCQPGKIEFLWHRSVRVGLTLVSSYHDIGPSEK